MLTIELPLALQSELERAARSRFGKDDLERALIEAVELWLARPPYRPVLDAEADANDRAYEQLREELEREHWGQWVVISHGKLQGVGDTLEEIDWLALDAHDRIVMQVGEQRPKMVELGWEASFQ